MDQEPKTQGTNENLTLLHKQLVKDNYAIPADYKEFESTFQNPKNAKDLFDQLTTDKYAIPEDYNSFLETFGLKKKDLYKDLGFGRDLVREVFGEEGKPEVSKKPPDTEIPALSEEINFKKFNTPDLSIKTKDKFEFPQTTLDDVIAEAILKAPEKKEVSYLTALPVGFNRRMGQAIRNIGAVVNLPKEALAKGVQKLAGKEGSINEQYLRQAFSEIPILGQFSQENMDQLATAIENAGNPKDIPNDLIGKTLSSTGSILFDLLNIRVPPMTKMNALAKYGMERVPMFPLYLGTMEGATAAREGKPLKETVKATGEGIISGLTYEGMGVAAGRVGQLVRELGGSQPLTTASRALANGVLFGADSKAKGGTFMEGAAMGLVFGGYDMTMEGINRSIAHRAYVSYLTATDNNIRNIARMNVDANEMRKASDDLWLKYEKETDPAKKAEILEEKTEVDNIININAMSQEIIKNPKAFTDAIMRDDKLSEKEKITWTEKINNTVKNADPRIIESEPILAEIKQKEEELQYWQDDEASDPMIKAAKIESITTQIEEQKKALGNILNKPLEDYAPKPEKEVVKKEEMVTEEPLTLQGKTFADKAEMFKYLDETATQENGAIKEGWMDTKELPNTATLKAINEWEATKKQPEKVKAESKYLTETPKQKIRRMRSTMFKKGSRSYKAVNETAGNFEDSVMQYFIAGGRVSKEDFIANSGWGEKDIKKSGMGFLLSKNGQKLDVFHEALENSFGMEEKGSMDMINSIVDVMKSNPTRGKMLEAFEKRHNIEQPFEPTVEEIAKQENDEKFAEIIRRNGGLNGKSIDEAAEAGLVSKEELKDFKEELENEYAEQEQTAREWADEEARIAAEYEGGSENVPAGKKPGKGKEEQVSTLYQNKKTAPKNIKDRFGIAKTEDQDVIKSVPKTLIREENGMEVYDIDGTYIRDNIYTDYTMGGHDLVYPEFVPKGEIWVDKDMNPTDKEMTIKHELFERQKMSEGLTYEKAHKEATAYEDKLRLSGEREESPLEKRMREEREKAIAKVDYTGFINDISKQIAEPKTKEEKADLMNKIETTVEKAGYKFEVDWDEDPDFSTVNIYFEGESIEPSQLPDVMRKIFDNYTKLLHESHENAVVSNAIGIGMDYESMSALKKDLVKAAIDNFGFTRETHGEEYWNNAEMYVDYLLKRTGMDDNLDVGDPVLYLDALREASSILETIDKKPSMAIETMSKKSVAETIDILKKQLPKYGGEDRDVIDYRIKTLEDYGEFIQEVIDNKLKPNEEPVNKPDIKVGTGAENIIPGGTETSVKPVKTEGKEKPVRTTDVAKQKQIDAINKDYDTQIADQEAIIPKADADMRKALLEADRRNGLFGDTTPLSPDEIIKREEQGFTYNEETRQAVRRPFEEKIAEANKKIAELNKERESKIGEVLKQQTLGFEEPAKEVKPTPQGIEYKGKTYTDIEQVQDDYVDGKLTLNEQNEVLEKVRKFEDGLRDEAKKISEDISNKIDKGASDMDKKIQDDINDKNSKLFVKFFPDVISRANTALYNQLVKVRDVLANGIANQLKKGVVSQTAGIRWSAKTLTNLYNGLLRTQTDVHGKPGSTGKLEMMGTVRAYAPHKASDLLNTWRNVVNSDPEALNRVWAVLDPELATKAGEKPLTYGDLSQAEKNLYFTLKEWNTWVWSTNYANGLIPTESHLKFKGDFDATGYSDYIARMYDAYEEGTIMSPEIQEFISRGNSSVTSRLNTDYMKLREETNEWKQEHAIKDPAYLTAKRVMQTIQNVAVKQYMDLVIDQHPEYVKKIKRGEDVPKGFTKLGSSYSWGPLRNRAVANHIVEDFTGFFYQNALANSAYDAIKMFDRNKINQFYKKYRTVYNPFVQTGNVTGNVFFASINGINPFSFVKGMVENRNLHEKNPDLYDRLLKSGLIGDVAITGEMKPLDPLNPKESLLGKADVLATKAYAGADNLAKISAYQIFRRQGMTHEKAVRRAYDAFQNYSTVGKTWDVASKIPLIGPTFVKFQADLQRILVNNMLTTPLTTIGTFIMIKMFGNLASALSGETEEEQKIRETRKGVAKIPFVNIPLSFKVGKAEVNVARYITPLFIYPQGDNEMDISELSKFMPLQFQKKDEDSLFPLPAFADATWGWVGSVLADRDFRMMSIQDPRSTKYTDPNITTEERIMNVLNFAARSQIPFYKGAQDIYKGATGQLDYYGRKRNWYQAILNNIIKVQEFDKPELKSYIERNLDYLTSRYASLATRMGDANSNLFKAVKYAQDKGLSEEVVAKLYKSESKIRDKRLQKSLDEQVPILEEIERLTTVYKKWYPQDPFIQENYQNIESGKNQRFNILNDIDMQKKYKDEYMLLKSNDLLKKPQVPSYLDGKELSEQQRKDYLNTYWSEYVRQLDYLIGLTQEEFDDEKKYIVGQEPSTTSPKPKETSLLEAKASGAASIAKSIADMNLRNNLNK